MSHLPATTTPTALELSTPGLTEALAERWLLSLPSANTRAAYRRDLAAFASWCAEQGATPLEAGRYELDAYRDHLAQLGRKPATIARALSALSSFYEYALDAAPQLLSANPAARVKRPKVSAESSTLGLSKAEAEAFLAAARASSATDYALGCLLLLNGLRVSEALGLDVADYYPEGEHYVAEVLGKGGTSPPHPGRPRCRDRRPRGWPSVHRRRRRAHESPPGDSSGAPTGTGRRHRQA